MTKDELYEIADIFYRRYRNITIIMLNENESKKRRAKAKKLFKIMHPIIMRLIKIFIELSKQKRPV